jgi:hypothetical protein
LFAGAYALYVLPACVSWRERLRALALAALAPCAWAAFDLAVTGDPLYSLHGTQGLAVTLDRPRDLTAALLSAPTSMSTVLGTTVALAGIVGGVAAILTLYRRALLPVAMIAVGLCCFIALGLAGLPILSRYLMVPIVALCLFAAVAVFGWSRLEHRGWLRATWMVVSLAIAGMLATGVPHNVHQLQRVNRFMSLHTTIEQDLHALAADPVWNVRGDREVRVMTRRAVPLLAVWLDLPSSRVSASDLAPDARVLVVAPATDRIRRSYFSLTTPRWEPVPRPGWRELYRNGSWVLYETAGGHEPGRPAARPS